MLTIWISIVAALLILAAVVIPITAATQRDNMRRLESLMNAHEANLRSGDPAKVAESKERWQAMCRNIQSIPRMAMLGLDLERWGQQAEREVK
jgi:hypothetical protein